MLFAKFGQGPLIEPSHQNICKAICEQALNHSEVVALKHLDQSMTYKTLTQQSNQLALHLIRTGVKPGDHVALFVQRSIPMIVGILAILKVGAAYVPQDARIVPSAQLSHVIKAANTKVILTLTNLKHLVPVPDGHVCIAIDDFLSEPPEEYADLTLVEDKPSDNCFVLFTSGTTGMQNGVQVTHGNVSNILLTAPGSLGMRPGIKVSQILNISFDMAAWEILGALSHGATLVIRGKDIEETVRQVDVVIATPSILSSLKAELCRNVKVVAVAGEPCPQPLAEQWSQFSTFYNCCGPTEVTIVNTMQNYNLAQQQLTIGKPTPNNTVYILNEDRSPCAVGEIGEMWAGGDCVSKGYIGNETLNQERYKEDPFLGKGHVMFRTRDLGRWNSKGELEHFGRTDDQVKIRGFRVELDSISKALESVYNCKQAVTLKIDSRHLVSFVTPRNVDLAKAKKAIEDSLPYYCTPSVLMALDEFPMTSRGKIDKRALTILAVAEQEKAQVIETEHWMQAVAL
jgi:D-alanine--poly(phosphoribitol) ligase subunit 1